MIPLKEIEKGMLEMASDKVEKQMNFLIRIYKTSFDDLLKVRVESKQVEYLEEIKLYKGINRNL